MEQDIIKYIDYLINVKQGIENKTMEGKPLSFYEIYGYENEITKRLELLINI